MAMQLNNLKVSKKSRSKKQRLGRGDGSGRGSYSGRGLKGQRSRSGGKSGLKLKGFKRNLLNLPKFKGMKSDKEKNQIVTLNQLNINFKSGDKVTPEVLLKKKIITDKSVAVKILHQGEINAKIEVADCLASKSARIAIEKAGGSFKDTVVKEEK